MSITNAVEDFINAGIADGKAPRTIKDYRRVLHPFSEWCEQNQVTSLSDLTKEVVRSYSKYLREENGWAESTWAIYMRVIRAFLRWLFQEGLVPENFALAIKSPRPTMKVEALPTDDEIKQLLQSTEGERLLDQRDLAVMLTFLDTGIRVGELVILTIDKWIKDGERSRLLIFAPKTKQQRYVFLGRRATEQVERYLALREEKYGRLRGNDVLFAGRGNKPMTTCGIREMISRRANQVGLDPLKWHPHLFRKIFATIWLSRGGGDFYLQYLAGWRSPEMVKIYATGSLPHIQAIHDKVGLVDNLFTD